jgi:hypothetical protein
LKDRAASDSYWHKISSCTRDSKVCGKMGRSINGVPETETETVDLPGHNFPHPSLGHSLEPLLFLPKFIQKPHLKRKTNITGSCPGSPKSPGSWVDRVLPGCCIKRSFNKSEPVQPPGPGSTRRAGVGLISMVSTLKTNNL